MSFSRRLVVTLLLAMAACLLVNTQVSAQETTGGLQGTVKDSTGAVVSSARVEVTGNALLGTKAIDTDSAGYYRFANLPPGTYTITVTAKGFKTEKREGLAIETGHLPTVDITLEVGGAAEVVEVSGAAPVIDVTTNTNQTNLTAQTLNDTPHGYSFQSVIQYAPMARNEPLAGNSAGMTGNANGSTPGSSGNGLANGFSIGGAADSESSYLIEGQDTENISGGASNANVPFPFIQEVQIKTSGIEAEHGGALGGVVNVVMKKGSNAYHGSFFGTYEGDGLDGSENGSLRYDPNGSLTPGGAGGPGFDSDAQIYVPKRDHFRNVQPGFTVGGPIAKDRLWFFLGFAPQYQSLVRTVNFSPSSIPSNSVLGIQGLGQDSQTYYATGRLDLVATQKIRLFGSWLYQYERSSGVSLPTPDSVNGLVNTGYSNGINTLTGINTPITQYSHALGFSTPNATYNIGADVSLTPKIVATTRYGYFFTNYHDFGWPTSGVNLAFQSGGLNANGTPVLDNSGAPLPVGLQQLAGTTTAPFNASFTAVNASKHYQFNQDVAFFKGGWWGTHNIKAGYQFNRLSNVIDQHGNIPFINMFPGAGQTYGPGTLLGSSACYGPTGTASAPEPGSLASEWGVCAGQYGWVQVQDFATILKTPAGQVVPATDNNHALFVQDAWTIGHGLTLNLGIRIEKETLPAPPGIGTADIKTISFAWSDKIAPRLGAAWGSRDGKMKIFGSYGVTNDVMKLLLAQTSFGAQGFEWCNYPLGPDASGGFTPSDLDFAFNAAGRACPTGVANVGAVFANGTVPPSLTDDGTGTQLIENLNLRPEEPVSPGLKPYRQHEFVGGWDYQIGKNWAFEARYDRRRLDHVIEDASLADPSAFEIYTIVNPGQGVDSTLNGYANYLTSIGEAYGPGTVAFNPAGGFWTGSGPGGTCLNCPHNPQAIRDYDGLEFRLTKSASRGLSGMFSYTWSRLWGNYAGLTTTDETDGGAIGRNSPDTSRSFDEPFFYFNYKGQSNAGPLPTDRPNTLKGYMSYALPWAGSLRNNTTTFGLFQVAYQGSPMSSFADLGAGRADPTGPYPYEATYLFGRGNWVNATAAPGTGAVTVGSPYARRTPWYTQTDANLQHAIKVNKNNEHQVLSFNATLTNLLNQHAVTSYWESLDTNFTASPILPNNVSISGGALFYQTAEGGYSPQQSITNSNMILNSLYGMPNRWQLSRNIRLGATFSF